MSNTIFIAPVHAGVGLVTVTLGMMQAMKAQGVRVGVLHVLSDPQQQARLEQLLPGNSAADLGHVGILQVQTMMMENRFDDFLAQVIAKRDQLAASCDVILVKGLSYKQGADITEQFNQQLARALAAQIILVNTTPSELNKIEGRVTHELELAARIYGGLDHSSVLGVVFNKVGSPHHSTYQQIDLLAAPEDGGLFAQLKQQLQALPLFSEKNTHLLGTIPWERDFYAPRTADLAKFLRADVLHAGRMDELRVHRVKLCARTVNNVLHVLQPNTLLVTAGDRADILLASSLAALKGVQLAGLIMTGKYQLSEKIVEFCNDAFLSGFPLLTVPTDSYETVVKLKDFKFSIPADDQPRIDSICEKIIEYLDMHTIMQQLNTEVSTKLSPAAFQYQLMTRAKQAAKRIVLPEGEEERTIHAAVYCAQQKIAEIVLLGDTVKIKKTMQVLGYDVPENLTLLDPTNLRDSYVAPLVKLRGHKGVTEVVAQEYLENTVMLGTMMLQQGDVDGLVSGAVHTTADTIRPALQIIKTSAEFNLVSSVFFMCLPEQVLVFGDCAVNPEPNAEQLAEIAIQSAATARAFGIEPRVAMLSYSTGASGAGANVEKVQRATALVRERCPELDVDGPLQYDAAVIASVAQQKAPQSIVAGRATVLVFPDLNTGNTTYKAVQRSANIISVGPMLQGLNKPVNDLSRGATVRDIIYTIAITAIQADAQ